MLATRARLTAEGERSRKRARRGGHSVPLIISLVMARTDNSSFSCLNRHRDPPAGGVPFFLFFFNSSIDKVEDAFPDKRPGSVACR